MSGNTILYALDEWIKLYPHKDCVVLDKTQFKQLCHEIGAKSATTSLMIKGKIILPWDDDMQGSKYEGCLWSLAGIKIAKSPTEIKYNIGLDPAPGNDWVGWALTPTPEPAPTKVYHKSGSDEHGTPQVFFDVVNTEFKFDLDVCASAEELVPEYKLSDSLESGRTGYAKLVPSNAKCPIYFTKADDALTQHWFGSVWMNPPYTKGQVKIWIGKLIAQLQLGNITRGVALVAARPDTEWFFLASSYACEIRFLKGRLTFEGSKDPAPFPSALLVFDKTKKNRIVSFWDWKKGVRTAYAYAFGASPNPVSGLLGKYLTAKQLIPSGMITKSELKSIFEKI